MAQMKDDERSNILLIFIAGSAVIVIVLLVVFVALVIISQVAPRALSSGPMPYGFAARPLPTAGAVPDILPDSLGKFKRSALDGGFDDFSATYTSGTDKIRINGSQEVSMRAAQAVVMQFARTNSASTSVQQLNGDPSYFLSAPDKGPARLVWSRDRWFFDVQASSKAALDAFMSVFKY
jgi:hypothetical protein